MNLPGSKPASYYGRSSFKYVEPLLNDEKEILIVSPYIDTYYANYLRSHARGKRILVISSAIGKDDAKKLISRRRAWLKALFFLLVLSSIGLVLVSAGTTSLVFLAMTALIFPLFLVEQLRLKEEHNISLKIPKSFVHAKLYVGKNAAVEGSANLTFAGMHKNVEHVSVTRDPQEISELRKQFWRIWNEE